MRNRTALGSYPSAAKRYTLLKWVLKELNLSATATKFIAIAFTERQVE